jgi:hypothetical protein
MMSHLTLQNSDQNFMYLKCDTQDTKLGYVVTLLPRHHTKQNPSTSEQS